MEKPTSDVRWVPRRGPYSDEELARVCQFLEGVGVKLHPGQREFIRERAHVKILLNGRRWGKSFVLAVEILLHVLEMHQWGYDWGRIRLVAPNYNHINEILNHLKRMINTAGLPMRQITDPRDPHYEIGECRLEARPAMNKKSLRGAGLSLLIIDEASEISEDIFQNELLPTITDLRGKLLIAGTPRGVNWVVRFAERSGIDVPYMQHSSWRLLKSPDGHVVMMRAPSHENPYVPRDEIEKYRQKISDTAFRQEWEAEILLTVGKPFPQLPKLEKPRMLPFGEWHVGLDYGFDSPSAAVFGYYESTGNLIIVKTAYEKFISDFEYVGWVLRNAPRGFDASRAVFITDPSFFVKDGRRRLSEWLIEAGWRVLPASRDRELYWQRIREWIAAGRLVVWEDWNEALLSEMALARPHKTKDQDIIKPDHALCALAYILDSVSDLAGPPQPSVAPYTNEWWWNAQGQKEQRLTQHTTKPTRRGHYAFPIRRRSL